MRLHKESIKNITLVVLIIFSILLFSQLWFSGKVTSQGYRLINEAKETVLRWFGYADQAVLNTASTEEAFLPKRIVLTSNGKRRVVYKGSKDFSGCYSRFQQLFTQSGLTVSKPAAALEEEWASALKSQSVLFDFGNVYATELLSRPTLILPGSAAKELLLTPGDSVIGKPALYIRDYPSGDIQKLMLGGGSDTLDEILQTWLADENAKNLPFAFELGFDGSHAVQQAAVEQNILLDSTMTIGLKSTNMPSVRLHSSDTFSGVAQNQQLTDQLLKLFKMDRSVTRRYIEQNDVYVYVDRHATLKLYPSGYLEYTAEDGGLDLSDGSGQSSAAQSVESVFSLVRSILRLSELGDIQLQLASDMYGYPEQDFSASFQLDYLADSRIAMIHRDGALLHPVGVQVQNGKLVSLSQYIYGYTISDAAASLEPTLKAVDRLYGKLQDKAFISEIYPVWILDEANQTQLTWCAKRKENGQLIILEF